MNSILDRIASHKKIEVREAKRLRPIESFSDYNVSPVRDFVAAVSAQKPSIIAEIKKASPSKGILRSDFDVAQIAEVYASHGASCLSVLTDKDFFQGDPAYLAIAKAHCNLPVLRKDFIIDAYQIHESLALGADCILLVAAMLDDYQLRDFCQIAEELKLAILIESHTEKEIERSVLMPAPLMGINNRSLHTFVTDLQCSIRLRSYIPKDKIAVSESGIQTYQDIAYLQNHNIHTFLIGESLMRAPNMGKALQQLLSPG